MTLRRLLLILWLGLVLPLWPRAALAGLDLVAVDYPVFLFTRNLLANVPDSRVSLLAAAPGCPHDQILTPAALEAISRAEILVSGGLDLDSFLERALGVAKTGLKIIDASGGGLAVRPEENQALVLDLAAARNWYRASGPERPDPHLFASLSGAAVMISNLAEALGRLDPDGAQLYRSKANEINAGYKKLLYDLQAVAALWSPKPRVILSHGSLRYLASDLGLEVADIIDGSEEAPVSAARLGELVNLARDCAAVLADPDGRLDLARIVGAEARRPVAVIDPVTSGPADPPGDYFQKVMRTNLAVLHELFTRPPTQPKPEPAPPKPAAVPAKPAAAPAKPAAAPPKAAPAPQKPASTQPKTAPLPPKLAPAPAKTAPAPAKTSPAPQKTESAPAKSAPAPQKPASTPPKTAPLPPKAAPAPQKTESAPAKASPAPQKSESAPPKTAPAPQKTAPSPQKTAPAPQKTAPLPPKPGPK